jgi:hypothetical protein
LEIAGKSKKSHGERRIGERPRFPKLASEKYGCRARYFGDLVGDSGGSHDWIIFAKKEKLSPIAGEDARSEIHGHAEMRKARRGHHRLQQFIYICSNP